jgi:hypothetical protein
MGQIWAHTSGFGVASKSSVVLPVVDTWHCIIHRIEAIAAATNNELPIAITSIIQIVSCFEPPARQSTKQMVFSQIWSNQLFIHALLLLCTTTVLEYLWHNKLFWPTWLLETHPHCWKQCLVMILKFTESWNTAEIRHKSMQHKMVKKQVPQKTPKFSSECPDQPKGLACLTC